MANRGPNPGGQQKQLSPVIKLVRDFNDSDLAAWQTASGVSDDSFNRLAFTHRDEVNTLIKPDGKGFLLAAQKLISLLDADPDSGLSAADLAALKADVFNKTAEAIAKSEKEKTEAEAAKKKAEATKKAEEAGKKTAGEVHNFADFLTHTLGSAARAQRQTRFIAFATLLTLPQKENFASRLKEGDQTAKFEALTQCATASEAVVLAETNGWI